MKKLILILMACSTFSFASGSGAQQTNLILMISPIVLIVMCLSGFIFWFKTLIYCLKNEASTGNDKIVWMLIILFLNIFGAFIYHFVRKPQLKAL